MFFNSNDPRTQLQARLNCESRAQHSSDTSCSETDFSGDRSTTIPGGNGTDRTMRPLFTGRSGSRDSASKRTLGRSPTTSD